MTTPDWVEDLLDVLRRYCPSTYDHFTDGRPCWCQPETICMDCKATAPCIHGADRDEIVMHREAS